MEQKRNTENGGFLGLRSMASGSKTGDAEHGGKSTYAPSAAESEDPSKKSDPKSVDECNIELKLGKRAFYGVAVKAVATGQAQAKKARGLPHMSQTPRCQVEGCDEELSNAKDYHKRHKVCEVHSKTAQVRVNGMDQRFCQQCSRFHELKEFDEGKRSCRRRLKGHNERRRKQPYQTGLNATRLPLSFNDSRFGSLFTDRPFLIHPRFNPNPVLQDIGDFKSDIGKRTWPRILKSENETYEHLHIPTIQQHSYAAPGKVLTFLQGSKPSYSTSAVSGHDYSHYIPSSGSPVGQALSLSSSGTDISGVTCAFQRLPGVSDSGRALSLLSTQSWIPRSSSASDTVASISSMDQMINNQSHMGQIVMQGLQQNYELAEDKILTISSQAQSNIVSNGYSTTAGNSSLNKQHNNGTGLVSNNGGLGSFDMRMPGLFQVPGIGCPGDATSQDARCTINLMCRSSNAQSNESHVESDSGLNGNSPFSICESGRSYDSTIFYPQQML